MPAPGHRRGKQGEAAQKLRDKASKPGSVVTVERDSEARPDSAFVRQLKDKGSRPCSCKRGKCAVCGGKGRRTSGNCSACDGAGTCAECGGTGKHVDQEYVDLIDQIVDRGAPIRELIAAAIAVNYQIDQDLKAGTIEKSTTGYRAKVTVLETARKLVEQDVAGKIPSAIDLVLRPRTGIAAADVAACLELADDLDQARVLIAELAEEADARRTDHNPWGDTLEVG